jgi:hypothetical protein
MSEITRKLLWEKKEEVLEVIAGLERMLREKVAYLDAINKELEKEDES